MLVRSLSYLILTKFLLYFLVKLKKKYFHKEGMFWFFPKFSTRPFSPGKSWLKIPRLKTITSSITQNPQLMRNFTEANFLLYLLSSLPRLCKNPSMRSFWFEISGLSVVNIFCPLLGNRLIFCFKWEGLRNKLQSKSTQVSVRKKSVAVVYVCSIYICVHAEWEWEQSHTVR